MDKLNELKLPDNADGALITSDINRRYFTGMKSSAGMILKFKECSYLIIDFRYIEKARNTVKNCTVIEQENLSEQIRELMKRHNAKSLAVESMDMTVHRLHFFEEKFPEIEFIKSDELSNNIYDMRTVKTPEEISKIRKAQGIAEKAFIEILDFIREGVTEREIALKLDSCMMENGAESMSFETIALAGANTSMPHGVPGSYKVKKGDFVLMDFGAVYDGYHSDMTRTVCVGEPSDKMKQVYNIVLDAQLTALDRVKAGITGKKMDSYARDIIEAAGFGECFGHSLGHGVGMEIHEFPTASSKSETILKENMVVTVEPGIYIPGEFGVRIEDFVVVTENSHENLTKCPKKLIIL
ncbi:M24 family metallopeptidase [Porcipelethomonas sp.]|uniref:M24 family metallopeptidase n=1 Tax=Porcipelethomonas sp. TaxID=2981675 RepID=UPI003EF9CCD3